MGSGRPADSGGTAPNTADLNLLGTITGAELEALRSWRTQASALTAAESSSKKSPVLLTFWRPGR